MIHIGIVGSRAIDDDNKDNVGKVYDFLDYIFEDCELKQICIHSGGAKGIDRIAIYYAIETGIQYKEHLPDFLGYPYNIHKNTAYFKRNKELVDEVNCLIAITRGESRGTQYTINYATETLEWIIEAEFMRGHEITYDKNQVERFRPMFLLPRCER